MINKFLTIEIKFSESHLLFPKIILIILAVLGVAIIIEKLIKRHNAGGLTNVNFKFFVNNYDKVKLFGTIATLIGYVFLLEKLGFLYATIIYMFITTVLFTGDIKTRTLFISGINSLATSFIVWYIFAYLINITLP